jgi:hypothetical protein
MQQIRGVVSGGAGLLHAARHPRLILLDRQLQSLPLFRGSNRGAIRPSSGAGHRTVFSRHPVRRVHKACHVTLVAKVFQAMRHEFLPDIHLASMRFESDEQLFQTQIIDCGEHLLEAWPRAIGGCL